MTEQELEQAYGKSFGLLDVVHLPDTGLVVLDVKLRTYVGLSRDGSYFHMVQAATPEMAKAYDYVDDNGLTVSPIAAGDLVCTCPGGRWKRTCYRITQAEAFERSLAEDIAWGLSSSPLMADEPAATHDADQPIPESATPAEPVPA